MTYRSVADIHDSYSLRRRLYAAASEEQKTPNAEEWVDTRLWELAGTPGWGAAWDSALAGGIEDPGKDEGVITDGMILSAVQPMS